jgi:hypothetical protein
MQQFSADWMQVQIAKRLATFKDHSGGTAPCETTGLFLASEGTAALRLCPLFHRDAAIAAACHTSSATSSTDRRREPSQHSIVFHCESLFASS